MPAVITHDLFGKDVYDELHGAQERPYEEYEAFLLGNQGPDVLYFCALSPTLADAAKLGSQMHRCDPTSLIAAFRDAAADLVEEVRPLGMAYAAGFVCHYALDASLHPFVYAQEAALTGAGVTGLDDSDAHEVHAEIESELDVLALSAKTGCTIAEFVPAQNILRADARVLEVVSCLYKRVASQLFGKTISKDAFAKGVKNYRSALSALYSPTGVKRSVLGRLEKLVRRHSFLQAMSHRNELLTTSPFENREHATWTDPGTGAVRHESFWDLYDAARIRTRLFLGFYPTATNEAIGAFTNGLDFRGKPTTAIITAVEDVS